MSNLQRNSSVFLAAMLLATLGTVASGEQPASLSNARKCAEYRLSRVAFLLGCCGDLPVAYPGERFASPLSGTQRATLALREVDLALRSPCPQDRSEDRLDLLLNRIGAYALRARERAEQARLPAGVDAGLHDATIAASELRSFTQSNPDAAVRIWPWIAMTFRRSGRPLEAIWFLNSVEEKCCRKDKASAVQMAVVKADTWFDLAMYGAATEAYAEWLSAADEASLCGRNRSLDNIAELRRRGFAIKSYAVERSSMGVCVPPGEWEPYAGVPR